MHRYSFLAIFWLGQFLISVMFLLGRIASGMPFNEAGLKFLIAVGLSTALTGLMGLFIFSYHFYKDRSK